MSHDSTRATIDDARDVRDARYAAYFSAMGDGMIVFGQDERVREMNPAALAMLGLREADAVGRHFSSLVDADGLQRSQLSFAQVLQTGHARDRNVRVRRVDGSTFVADVSSERVQLPDEVAVVVLLHDTTAHVEVRRTLRQHARLQAAVTRLGELALSSSNVQALCQAATQAVATELDAPLCEVLQCLPGQALLLRAATGWRDGLVGKATLSAQPETQAGFTLSSRQPVIVDDVGGERRFQLSPLLVGEGVVSGLTTSIRPGGDAYGVLGVHTKVARQWQDDEVDFVSAVANVLAQAIARAAEEDERVAATAALARAQNDLRRVLDSLGDAVAAVRNDTVIYVNAAGAQGLGYRVPAELVGKSIFEVLPPEEHLFVRERMANTRKAGATLAVREARVLRKDGATVWAEVSATLVSEFDGGPALLVFARSVSERRKVQEQLMVADRMASIGTLASGVAHEINNPLAAVVANIELAARAVDESAARARARPVDSEREREPHVQEIQEELADARQAADRVRMIVRDLKLFSRSEEKRSSRVEVQRVLDSCMRLVMHEIRRRARLVTRYEVASVVEANEARLGQVFLNLLLNAAQAIPEGDPDGNTVCATVRAGAPGQVEIEISDTGAGIAPEHERRLFTPFFTTKAIGKGTGLGLAICHRIVSALGGEISVHSQLGKGTQVRVLLPLAGPVRAATASMPASASGSATGSASGSASGSANGSANGRLAQRGRVLVVDDEASITTTLRRVLGRDHEVIVAISAEEGLGRLRAGEIFDVILCDLMMPHMTGMELHQQLTTVLPVQAQRMIFLTGGAFTPQGRAFLDEVENPYVEKPFDTAQLRTLVNERVAAARS